MSPDKYPSMFSHQMEAIVYIVFTRGSWFVLTDMLLANGDELNLILPKFARPPNFLFSSHFLALP